jgi:molybdopterin-binding protein
MKISARNSLKGKITKITKGATTSHVLIDVNGATVTAAITNESVEELKLKEGMSAYAIVKASDVIVGVEH